jgi:hypothetical protein
MLRPILPAGTAEPRTSVRGEHRQTTTELPTRSMLRPHQPVARPGSAGSRSDGMTHTQHSTAGAMVRHRETQSWPVDASTTASGTRRLAGTSSAAPSGCRSTGRRAWNEPDDGGGLNAECQSSPACGTGPIPVGPPASVFPVTSHGWATPNKSFGVTRFFPRRACYVGSPGLRFRIVDSGSLAGWTCDAAIASCHSGRSSSTAAMPVPSDRNEYRFTTS